MQVDSTGTRLAPRQFHSAAEVWENRKRVLAFRQKSWSQPPVLQSPPVERPVFQKLPPILVPQGHERFLNAMSEAFSIPPHEIQSAIGHCTATAARQLTAALYCRFEWKKRPEVCKIFGIPDRILLNGLCMIDRILIEHQISARSPLLMVAQIIHNDYLDNLGRGCRYTLADIQIAVCEHFKISRDDILSHRRTANIVFPRQIAMALCKHLTLKSLPEIGRSFDGKDHTTVLHACRKMEVIVAPAKDSMPPNFDLSDLISVVEKQAIAIGLHTHSRRSA